MKTNEEEGEEEEKEEEGEEEEEEEEEEEGRWVLRSNDCLCHNGLLCCLLGCIVT